jgi:pyrroloquinoline quinone biosynthesis protein B
VRVTILGSAAGGGLPQWNCGCDNCVLVRSGSSRIRARTQDSIAIEFPAIDTPASASGAIEPERNVCLVNASPDVLQQLQATRALFPRGKRHSPIATVVLSNGDMDHILGLFSLRESYSFTILCTPRVWDGLNRNPMMRTLQRFANHVTFAPLMLGVPFAIAPGHTVTALSLRGKLPVHLEGALPDSPEDNVGLVFRSSTGRSMLYASACAHPDDLKHHATADIDVALVDGTFFTEDELGVQGLGSGTAKSMAHAPISGPNGSLAQFSTWAVKRTIYTHINNTNPVLIEDSPARAQVLGAGLEVAFDGMTIDV